MKNLKNCPGCGVIPNQNHKEGCGTERCSVCKKQRFACLCFSANQEGCKDHNPELSRWTGRYPGEKECEELGWFRKIYPNDILGDRCEKSHPLATYDLNRWAMFSITGKDK